MDNTELQAFASILGDRIVQGLCEKLPRAFFVERDLYEQSAAMARIRADRETALASRSAAESAAAASALHDAEVRAAEKANADELTRARHLMDARRAGQFKGDDAHNVESESPETITESLGTN